MDVVFAEPVRLLDIHPIFRKMLIQILDTDPNILLS